MGSSAVLQGQYVAGMEWFREQVAAALAERHGAGAPDDADVLAATLGQSTLDHAYRFWLAQQGRGDLRAIVERSFDLVKHLVTDRTADSSTAH